MDESGKRVDASTIGLTYDKWRGELLTNNVNDWKTVSLEKGQVAPTKNNLKEIAYPAQSLEILSDRSTQYSAANLTFTLPKYYGKISVYNKVVLLMQATCFQISKIIIVQNHLLKAYTKSF